MDTITLRLLLLLGFGLLQLFFGYSLFRFLVVLAGALVGFAYGPTLLSALTGRPVEPWMALTAALIAALVLGLLAWLAYWAVIFLWGTAIGYGAAGPAIPGELLPFLVALAVGVLAVLFQRILIVLLTALSGAWLTASVGALLLGLPEPGPLEPGSEPPRPLMPAFDEPLLIAVVLVLAALGAFVQFRRAVPVSRF